MHKIALKICFRNWREETRHLECRKEKGDRFIFVVVFFFCRQGLCVAHSGLELLILLPQPSGFWDYRHGPHVQPFNSLFIIKI
jgi:hypothetical protein